jgi:Beta-propeller domains of methanol dehydrogenase type
MHIKRIHEMVEELTECTLSAIKANESRVGDFAIPDVIDMIKDLCCAEKDAREAKEKEKEEEDEKKEDEYFLKMLKEEYGDEEGEKRFYSRQPRSRTSGRFMSRGDGRRSNSGRRGYEEMMPMDYRMDIEGYKMYPAEYWRDVDRASGRMYFSGGGSSGSSVNSGGTSGQSGSSGMSGGNSGGNSGGSSRGYSEGYSDGQSHGYEEGNRRGYSEGYEQGNRDGRSQGGNSRYDRAKRGYEESKEKHKGNTPQDNSENMKNLEELLNSTGDVIVKDYAPKMSQSEKAMAAQKFDTWSKMLKQQ